MFQYEATVIRIVDGDTLWLRVDLGFKIRVDVDVRLAHINTPEKLNYGISGVIDPAMLYINNCIPPGSTCVVEISRAEKWGRWLGTIRYLKGSTSRDDILRSGTVLNDELVKNGLARSYEGGKK